MKTLNLQETMAVTGGFSQATAASALALSIVTLAVASSLYSPAKYEFVTVYRDVVTPLYDANGRHYGDRIDKYEEVQKVRVQ